MADRGLAHDALAGVPIFAGVDATQRAELAAGAERLRMRAGEWVFREGEEAGALYVILSGRLEALIGRPGRVVRVLGRGAAVGELALLTGSLRSASVRARRDTELLAVSEERVNALLDVDPSFAISLTRWLAAQLQASQGLDLEPSPLPDTIGLVSQPGGPSARELAAVLARALGEGETTVLSAGDVAEEEYATALDRAERENRQVLLAAEAQDPPEWRAFCLRQADRELIAASGAPPAGGVPATAGEAPRDVLLAGRPPEGTLREWIDVVGARSGRLVGPPAEWPRTLASVARSLSGRSVGLALSGGGARGFAHIGVLRALAEAGVTIDRVAGVSMGAVVGAQIAMGLDSEAIRRMCQREFVRGNPMGDYTLPVVSLVRGRRAEAMVRRVFGDALIEELPAEFTCASCDLVTSELHLHRSGPVFEAVGASFCLPGIGPPVALGDRLLVDGGVLNNLPVKPLAGTGEGPVIASDVTALFQVPHRHRTTGPARARVRSAVLGRGSDIPLRLPEVIVRSITLGSTDTVAEADAHADLVIRPEVSSVGMVAFDQIDQLIRAGYEAAASALESRPELAA
jgi:NTE family protein